MTGWSDENTRNLETGTPAGTRKTPARTAGTSSARSASGSRRSTTGADEALDTETDMKTRELQAEIADTREDMAETIDAIQDRLRPSSIVSNATERVKAATTERVRNVAGTASDTAHDLVEGTRRGAADVVEGARQNPVPALMIGAGVAWLLMGRSRNKRTETRGWSPYATPRYGAFERSSTRTRTDHVAAGTGVDLTEPDYGDVDYTGNRSGSGFRATASDVSSRAGEMAEDARYALRRTTRNAQSGFQRLLRDNPLLVGAAAVLVGAAVGAALPETERENELMGETRDTVLQKAEEVARDAKDTVQQVAGDAARQVTDRIGEGH